MRLINVTVKQLLLLGNTQMFQMTAQPMYKTPPKTYQTRSFFRQVPDILEFIGLSDMAQTYYKTICRLCAGRECYPIDMKELSSESGRSYSTIYRLNRLLCRPLVALGGKSIFRMENGCIYMEDIWEESTRFMAERQSKKQKLNCLTRQNYCLARHKNSPARHESLSGQTELSQENCAIDTIDTYEDTIDTYDTTTILTNKDQSVVVALHAENSDQPEPSEFLQLAKTLKARFSSEPNEPTSPSHPANIASKEENSAMQHNIQNQTGPTLPCEGTSPSIISKIAANNAGIADEYDYLTSKSNQNPAAAKLTSPIKTQTGLANASNSYLKALQPIKTTRNREIVRYDKKTSQNDLNAIEEVFSKLLPDRQISNKKKNEVKSVEIHNLKKVVNYLNSIKTKIDRPDAYFSWVLKEIEDLPEVVDLEDNFKESAVKENKYEFSEEVKNTVDEIERIILNSGCVSKIATTRQGLLSACHCAIANGSASPHELIEIMQWCILDSTPAQNFMGWQTQIINNCRAGKNPISFITQRIDYLKDLKKKSEQLKTKRQAQQPDQQVIKMRQR